MKDLTGKCVLLGITGGIAAYKMANVASALHKAGAKVHVIMTENAAKFITPLTFETLTGSKCMIDTLTVNFSLMSAIFRSPRRRMLFWSHRPRQMSSQRWRTVLLTIC